MLAHVNQVLAEHGVNIGGQVLATRGHTGYVVTDTDSGLSGRGASPACTPCPRRSGCASSTRPSGLRRGGYGRSMSDYKTVNPATGETVKEFDTLDDQGVEQALARVTSGFTTLARDRRRPTAPPCSPGSPSRTTSAPTSSPG